jgi:hypothetical protein
VRTSPPTPRSTGLSRLFNPRFPGLKIRYRYAVTGTCGWHSWFSFISNLITIVTPSSPPPSIIARLEHRVSVFPNSIVVLLGRLPFAPLVLLFLLVNCQESSSLFGPLAPRLAASVVAHWGGNRTVPWPLVLKLLASTELCSTGPASPA